MRCHIDFETRSPVDLKACGAYRYAMHPGTGIYTLSYKFTDDDKPATWLPGQPFPERVAEHAAAGGVFKAWNAQFERLMWWYVLSPDYGVHEPALEQFQCTAAQCRAHGMPGKLDDATRALGIRHRKLEHGSRLIKEYCAQNVPWEAIPREDQLLMINYCEYDVIAEEGMSACLRELTPHEWAEYHLNERICDRGVPLDLAFIREAANYGALVRNEADGKIEQLTGGHVKTARQRKTRDEWVLPRLSDEQLAIVFAGRIKKAEKEGKVPTPSFEERRREELLVDPELDEDVRRYLELVAEAGGATLRKYTAMLHREIDGRLHGALIFNGAGQTGRFSSTGLQLHNLARSDLDDVDDLVELITDGYEMGVDNEADTLKQLVRASVYRAEGLSWADWSAIEGVVAPWLADSYEGEQKLDVFRQGVDPYKVNAVATFGVAYDDVTKDQRQAGKVQELALQFLGGVGALKIMGRGYGMKVRTADAEKWRDAWRKVNPWAKVFGAQLEGAAMRAVRHPGEWFKAGRVAYACQQPWLWCKLPCGRLLAYYMPRLATVETPWGDERVAVTCVWGAGKPKVGERWPRRAMRDGLFLENVTQATAASLLRHARFGVEARGLSQVLDVHDEIVTEGYCEEALVEIMLDAPEWAAGMPLKAEGGSGTRYGK